MITLTSTDAQSRFSEVLDTAQREPITITQSGRPLVFIFSPEELTKLLANQEKREQAVAAYKNYMERVKGKISPTANQLTDEDINLLVHELR